MATVQSLLTTFSSDATVGDAAWGLTPEYAEGNDNQYAQLSPPPVAESDSVTEYLMGLNLQTPPPAGAAITAVRAYVRALQTMASDTTITSVCLCDSTGIRTTVDVAASEVVTVSEQLFEFTFTQANLATLGINLAEVQASTFGFVVSMTRTDSVTAAGGLPLVDQMYMEVDYTGAVRFSRLDFTGDYDEDEDMFRYEPISKERLPSDFSTAVPMFPNPPPNVERILVTLRAGGLTMLFDGDTPLADDYGHDYGAGERIEFICNQTLAKQFRAVANGGTPAGFITYFKG